VCVCVCVCVLCFVFSQTGIFALRIRMKSYLQGAPELRLGLSEDLGNNH
jgi:hypothetical protein